MERLRLGAVLQTIILNKIIRSVFNMYADQQHNFVFKSSREKIQK